MAQLPHPVVALVSSAGGLESTVQVLSGVDPDLPATFIVLQHSRPDRRSLLPAILTQQTQRSAVVAREGDPLTAGRVLVAPNGCHTLVTHERTITLIPSGDFPPWRPSADLLLTSMALALGRSAVAVVLSGAGHDGATGATAVRHLGGVVVTSDAESSAHFSMPKSTIERDQIAPAVLPLAKLVEELPTLVQAIAEGTPLSGEAEMEQRGSNP
jgi:two-component system chemotaxis response regulator CheB